MKKPLVSVLIVCITLMSCISGTTALHYTENSLDNFVKVQTYFDGTFTDISGWYVPFVEEAYEYGIVSGVGNNKFAPLSNLTAEEAIAIGSRIHAVYKYGLDASESKFEAYAGFGNKWYSMYIAYAKAEKLITDEFDSLIGKPVTRAQMVYCWSKLLLPSDLPSINTVISLPDVNDSTLYKDEIIMMYKAGILSGTDNKGTFMPDRNITRAECSAIFMHLVDKTTRPSGRSFPDETVMIGDVPFNPGTDVERDNFTGGDMISIPKQNEFINSMISQSKGLTINKDFSVVDIDFTLIPLPEGFTWEMRVEWGGERWMGARLLTSASGVKTAVEPIDGHFISKLWREDEPIPTYIVFGASIQGTHGAAGTVFIQYNVDSGTYSINYGDKNQNPSLEGYEHWFTEVFHIDK